MKRCAVLITLLALSGWAVAQSTQTGTNTQTVVVPGTVAGPGTLSTNTGTAVIIAPPSAPLVVTPEVHLTTAPSAVGASNATPGNVAGATNSTSEISVTPRVITTVPQFASAGASVTQTNPPQETTMNTGVGTVGTNAAGTPIVVFNNRNVRFDRGVGSGASVGEFDNTGGRSLGEIAHDMRQRQANANARTYTNQDIERIQQQPGVTVGGMSGAAIGAGNATQQQQPSGNLPVVSQPTTNQPPNQGVSQPVPQNPPQSEAIPPSPLGQMQEQRQMAQANPPNAQAGNQQAPTASAGEQQSSSGRQLPSSGSILPLIAVVGFLAAGAGLLAR